MMWSRSFLLLTAVLCIAGPASVVAQSSSDCYFLEPVQENVCASFSLDGCLVDVTITIGSEVVFDDSVGVSALSDPTDTCNTVGGTCELCFGWESHGILQNGTAIGCITLYGSCIAENDGHTDLGCFADNALQLCPGECPNACSGHGVCQFDGRCDCSVGRAGDDCSATCSDRVETIDRLEESVTRHFTIEEGEESWMGYFFSLEGHQVASITAAMRSLSGSSVNFYSQKSCYPQPSLGLYDHYERVSSDVTPVAVTQNCEEIDGGVWFFYAACESTPCSFEITLYETPIVALQFNHQLVVAVQSTAFYSYRISPSGPFTVTVSTDLSEANLTVELLPYECPTDSVTFQHASEPSYIVEGNEHHEGVKQYVLSSVNAVEGTWYLRVVPPEESDMLSFSIVVNKATCSQQCQFGACTAPDLCVCTPNWTGPDCSLYNGPVIAGPAPAPGPGPAPAPGPGPTAASPSPSPSPSPKSNSGSAPNASPAPNAGPSPNEGAGHADSPSSGGDDDDGGLPLGAIIGGSVGLGLLLLVVVLVVVILGAVVVKKVKRNSTPPPDTLYNMLAHEQDLDAI